MGARNIKKIELRIAVLRGVLNVYSSWNRIYNEIASDGVNGMRKFECRSSDRQMARRGEAHSEGITLL